jgi:hypothetical protein
MRQPKGFIEYGKDGCCPDDWNHVPDMTGNFEMDGSIMRCRNKEAHAKLVDHLTTDTAYKINTAYGFSTLD